MTHCSHIGCQDDAVVEVAIPDLDGEEKASCLKHLDDVHDDIEVL